MKKLSLALLFLSTIPLANWMIGHVGTQSFPGGPHVVPVGFGYSAPSGVYLIGVALIARDALQSIYGNRVTLTAILVGIAISFAVNPDVALASALAFGLGELIDFAIYTPLRKRSVVAAMGMSGIIGGVVDSFVFLQIAFGSTAFWQGQVIGKTVVSLAGAAVLWAGSRVVSRHMESVAA